MKYLLTQLFLFFGGVSATAAVVHLLNFLKVNYFTKLNMKKKYGAAGDWAVVTGASEGIGHAMAMDLCQRGFNVCVIARTMSKLEKVVQEIEATGSKGLALSFDFSTANEQDWEQLLKKLQSIRIAVLVNNVGINYDYTNYFTEVDVSLDLSICKVNTESVIRLTKHVLPNMINSHAGAIVCLGSVTAVVPSPLLATYAGTKAFNTAFGKALFYELKSFGVDALAVTPNMVVSKMTQGRSSRPPKESFLVVNAAEMAHQTLNKLGTVPVTSGHANHSWLEAITTWLPQSFVGKKVLNLNLSVKKRAERSREGNTKPK